MKQRPLVWYALCWIAGYALGYVFQPAWLGWEVSLTGAALICGLAVWSPPFGGWLLRGALVAAVAAGVYAAYDRSNQSAIPEAWEESERQFKVRIVSPVQVDGDRASFQAKLLDKEGETLQVSIRLLKLEEKEIALGWKRGDVAELAGTLRKPGEARNFGGFDYRRYLRLQKVHWQLTVKGLAAQQVLPPAADDWGWWLPLRWNDAVRSKLADKVDQLFPEEQAGFMKGMLVGLTDDLDPQQFERFSKLGLTHIIAISGLNVAIFLACLLWIMRRFGMTKETYLLTSIALMPFYVLITGASPSIVRAGLMAMVALYAAYRNRLKDGLHITLLAAVAMLLWEPYYLMDVSFQLSFLVTIGLILGVPYMNRLLPIRQSSLKDAVSITVTAQLISFPISIYYFSQFSLLSLAANLVLVPVFSMLIMPGGTAALMLGLVWPAAGKLLAWLIIQVNHYLFVAIEWLAGWDLFQTIWPKPSPLWIVLYYLLLTLSAIGAVEWLEQTSEGETPQPKLQTTKEIPAFFNWRPVHLSVISFLCFSSLLFYGYVYPRWTGSGLVQFLDVGQGDSIMIQTPKSRMTLLVDGGGTLSFRKAGEEWKERKDPYEVGRKLLVPLLKQRGVQRIDYLIITHQDMDHVGGLQAVLEQIPVSRLIFNGTLKPTDAVEKLFETALAKGTQLISAQAGDRLEADELTKLMFLHPLGTEAGESEAIRIEKEQNESSLVFLMEMDRTRWLFTGDMDAAAEKQVLERWSGISSILTENLDVLKVAHHGSKSSTSDDWLKVLQPRNAVISAGVNNLYGHPNALVVERLATSGASLFRTDRQGEIQMRVREGKIEVRTKLAGAP
ncbi:DNA internalization-related competence protein ComEC/Rec2 [Paenibacillus silviterrae]|uniref:DNA internalization-related competence protein ComEC/Rec2 n=1 Tax=Paenibacillus silviterrae TaxID=3242194 RepID=UPI0025438705|nr:DNA internalization-related competence protein ComEC/Rec2 [Paenibacillus chinjuensis]